MTATPPPISCPACGQTMQTEDFGSIHVEVCSPGCHGIWFDEGELRRLDHAKKGMGPNLERALAQAPEAARERDLIDCPRCHEPMDQAEYEFHDVVTVDSCAGCGGSFLDAGELAILRARKLSEDEQSVRRRLRKRRMRRARQRREQQQRAQVNAAAIMFMMM